MRDFVPRIRELGGELVVVGNGSVDHARWFRDEHQLDFPLYTDPSLKAYDAAGMKRSFLSTMNPASAARSVKALAQGFRQVGVKGTAHQQGGAMVIDTDGTVAFEYISSSAGEHPEPELLVNALAGLGGSA